MTRVYVYGSGSAQLDTPVPDDEARSIASLEYKWSLIIRNLWLRRMLRGWMFHTDKLLDMDCQWRQACASLQREALLTISRRQAVRNGQKRS